MQEKWNAWYSKISITFACTTTASFLLLIHRIKARNLVDFYNYNTSKLMCIYNK